MPNRSFYQIQNVPEDYRLQLKILATKNRKTLAQAFIYVMNVFKLCHTDRILRQRLEQLTNEGMLERWYKDEYKVAKLPGGSWYKAPK